MRRTKLFFGAALISGLVALACSDEPTGTGNLETMWPRFSTWESGSCSKIYPLPSGLENYSVPGTDWGCDSVVTIVVSGDTAAQHLSWVSTAKTRWNLGFDTPIFGNVVTANPPSGPWIGLSFNTGTSGQWWCGGNTVIQRVADSTSTCPGENPIHVDNITTLIAHELGHEFKFQHWDSDYKDLGHIEFNCIMRPRDDGTLNGAVCDHEREQVFLAFGIRDSVPDYSAPMRNSVDGSASSSGDLEPNETRTFFAKAAGTVPVNVEWAISGDAASEINTQGPSDSTVLTVGLDSGTVTVTGTIIEQPNLITPRELETTYPDLVFNVTYRPEPPPELVDPTIVANAPTQSIKPNQECQFVISNEPLGGVTPLTYVWKESAGASDTLSIRSDVVVDDVGTGNLTLWVQVTDNASPKQVVSNDITFMLNYRFGSSCYAFFQ